MQAIDRDMLRTNAKKFLVWQNQRWNQETHGIRLHLGSGHIHLDKYINVDPYTEESDAKYSMTDLPFEPNSVFEIVSHHALEHLPLRQVWETLRHWYRVLEPGGTIEIGIPDVELCFQSYLEATERDRLSRDIWTVYGSQADLDSTPPGGSMSPRDGLLFCDSQTHKSGFSLGTFVRMIEDIGFRMIDALNYDGCGTPSLFVLAYKPAEHVISNPLEQNLVIGTFTNRTIYLPMLWSSVSAHLPHIPFVTRIQRGPINAGMLQLREDFLASGKRFWCFLDDDIQFLNPDIMHNALETLVNGKYGAVSVYSTFDPAILTEQYNPQEKGLVTRDHQWATGYFILVDSWKVGHILPDMNLPHPNTSVDTSYSIAIRAAGYPIAISADYVYHVRKETFSDPVVIEETNRYLIEKWGQFYFDHARYDGNVIEWGTGG